MPRVLVCDRWTLRLRGGEGGYYHYINERAGEVGRNAYCIRWLLMQLDHGVETVVEPFGGVGVFATVIQGVCKPRSHRLYDLDNDCLRQLETAFADAKGVVVRKRNARDTIGTDTGDLHVLDFPSPFTVLHHEDWGEQLERLFKSDPGAVIWMDGASFGMQWHADRYAQAFGQPVADSKDYARAMSSHVYGQYGYSVKAATVTRGCFYFAFTPGRPADFPLCKFTTKGRALRAPGSRETKHDPPQAVRVSMSEAVPS